MLFYYTNKFSALWDVSMKAQYMLETEELFLSYIERFVIFPNMKHSDSFLSGPLRDCFFSYFFSYDGYSSLTGFATKGAVDQMKGIAVSPNNIFAVLLKQRRGFLMQFGQRRVCTRTLAWFVPELWACWPFDGVRSLSNDPVFSRYSYKHLAQSDLFSAGILLGQPNLYFFVYLLSNPYFWGVLQQTLSSQFRYK